MPMTSYNMLPVPWFGVDVRGSVALFRQAALQSDNRALEILTALAANSAIHGHTAFPRCIESGGPEISKWGEWIICTSRIVLYFTLSVH